MTRRTWALFAAMCIIWGIPYLLIRVAVRDISPGVLVFARTGIGALVLLPFALRAGGFGPVLRRWRPLVVFSVVEMAGPWLLIGDAEKHLSSSLTGLLVAAVPLLGILIAVLTRSADSGGGPARYAGLLLGLAGVAVLLGLDIGEIHAGALVEMGVVVVGYAVAPVILSRYLSDVPSIPVVCGSLGLVAIGYLPYVIARPPTSIGAHAAWSVATLGVICTAVAFIVFFALIAEVGPSRATVFTYVNPAVALLLGVALLGEKFTLGIALGFPLILAGSVLAARVRMPVSDDAAIGGSDGRSRPAALADDVLAAVPAAVIAQTVVAQPLIEPLTVAGQSMRTSPDGVSNTAATRPVSSSTGETQSTSTPSSG